MKKQKSLLAFLLTAIFMFSFSGEAFASASLPAISSSKPLITYTYNSSGKVYAYTAADLKTKTGGYIACATDECKILKISGNAVQVKYPVSGGTKTAWFSREAFTYRDLANDAAKSTFNAKASVTTYKWKGTYTKLGSVYANDYCYLLRGDENSDWLQIIYPVSGGYKMGWVTGSDYATMTGKKTSTNSQNATSSSKSLADVAKGEVGYKGNGDYTKYGEWFGNSGQQWCATFVSWCVHQAGVSTSIVPRTAVCTAMQKSKYYKKWNSSALKNINKNDVIFFCSNSGQESHHVGIVYSVSGSKITLIEGNSSADTVKMNTYTVSNSSTGKIKNGSGSWNYFCGYIPVN